MALTETLENITQISMRLDIIELCGCQQRRDDGPSLCPAFRAGEQVVLASQRHRTDSALDGVRVEFDPTIVEEPAELIPAGKRIADRIADLASRLSNEKNASSRSLIADDAGYPLPGLFRCMVAARVSVVSCNVLEE